MIGSGALSVVVLSEENAVARKSEAGSVVHLPLDQLCSGVHAFGASVVVFEGDRSGDGVDVQVDGVAPAGRTRVVGVDGPAERLSIMPKAYPVEFRARAVALVRAGKSVRIVATELGISESCLHRWVGQDRVERGERPGLSSREHAELVAAKRRIRQLETELAIVREASKLYEELKGDPKERSR
jgi:transposase-like protein